MKKMTLQEQAYQAILRKVLDGEFRPGESMREAHIATKLGFSVTPVREALQQMAKDGWLNYFPYRGTSVREYSVGELEELSVLRESLEIACVDRFIENADAEDIRKIEENLQQCLRLDASYHNGEISAKDAQVEFLLLDSEFHQLIVEGTHCGAIIEHSKRWNMQLQTHVLFLKCSQVDHFPEIAMVVKQHDAILTGLKMRWGSAAREFLRCHITYKKLPQPEYREKPGKEKAAAFESKGK